MAQIDENPFIALSEYEFRYLAEHLEASGRVDDFHRLLALETSEQHNAWFEVKDRAGDTAGYLSDIQRALRLTEDMGRHGLNAEEQSRVIGLQIRYVLITATVNSLAANISASLLLSLVDRGAWPLSQGIIYARRISDHDQRKKALMGLALQLPDRERILILQEALQAARMIDNDVDRKDALIELAPHLPKRLQREVIDNVIAEAHAVEDYDYRVPRLASLAPQLAELGYYQEALETVLAIKRIQDDRAELIKNNPGLPFEMPEPPWYKVLALSSLAPCLSMARTIGLSLPVQKIEDKKPQTPVLSKSLLSKIRQAIKDLFHQSDVLVDSVPQLQETTPYVLVDTGPQLQETPPSDELEIARSINDLSDQLQALETITHQIKDGCDIMKMLPKVSSSGQLTVEDGRKRLIEVQQTDEASRRMRELVELAPTLPAPLFHEALFIVQETKEKDYDSPYTALMDIWGLAAHKYSVDVENYWADRSLALTGLAPYLPEADLIEAIEMAKKIQNEKYRKQAMAILTLQLAKFSKFNDSLIEVNTIESKSDRVNALVKLALQLGELGHREESLRVVKMIDNKSKRDDTLVRLIPYLLESRNRAMFYPIWCEILLNYSSYSRQKLLSDIEILLPAIAALGGKGAIAETVHSIQDVGRWCP